MYFLENSSSTVMFPHIYQRYCNILNITYIQISMYIVQLYISYCIYEFVNYSV